jgi:hypothetical protein
LTTPLAAVLSVLLPRVVNMNSVGSSSNAHALAGFAGVLAIAAAGAPCALLTLAAVALLEQPALAPVFVAMWTVVAFVIAKALFRPAERIFDQRRENLAMLM